MKILKLLFIIQTIDNNERKKKGLKPIGNHRNPFRLNPYNPLSYLFIPLYLVIAPIIIGYSILLDEFKPFKNPFTWQKL